MVAPFARDDLAWQQLAGAMQATVEGVAFACESRWWGKHWNVSGESAFAIPERMIVFVSERGMDHGFWRDLRVGEPAFDRRFFVFCDTPALLPIVLGEATRRALGDTGPNGHDVTLYVRDNRVRTRGTAQQADRGAIDRHLAIHRALADDHRAFLARWKERMDSASGRADATWPPSATLLRPSGALLVHLTWTSPTTRDASDWEDAAESLRTEVTAHDDRERIRWTLREVNATTPCTHVLAQRRFVLVGKLPFPLAQLEHIIRDAQLASIAVHANRVTVGLHGIATARQIEGAVRIIHLVVEATAESSSPYR